MPGVCSFCWILDNFHLNVLKLGVYVPQNVKFESRQFQWKKYRTQTPQNLALTKIKQKYPFGVLWVLPLQPCLICSVGVIFDGAVLERDLNSKIKDLDNCDIWIYWSCCKNVISMITWYWRSQRGSARGVLVLLKFSHFSSELTKTWSSGARKYWTQKFIFNLTFISFLLFVYMLLFYNTVPILFTK